MKKLNILQVLPAFNTGGVEEGALAISDALLKAGHYSFLASAGGSKVERATQQGAKHFIIPGMVRKNLFEIYANVQALVRIIQDNQIDIVHARSRWPAWMAYLACKRTNTPYMTTFHGAHATGNYLKTLYNSVMVRTPHVIAISDFLAQYIRTHYEDVLRNYHTHIHVIERGIDIDKFSPDNVLDEDCQELKESWGVGAEQKILLMPARLTRLKGHDVFIRALALSKAKNICGICIGAQPQDDPAYRQELEQLIVDLGLQETCKIAPATTKMAAAYRLADAVVFPSKRPEAFGRIVIEAQAMGVPIITANIGAQATLVDNGISGWLFENGNPHSLAQQINRVIDLPVNVRNMYAKNMRAHVLTHFTQEVMADKTFAVYAQIMKERNS